MNVDTSQLDKERKRLEANVKRSERSLATSKANLSNFNNNYDKYYAQLLSDDSNECCICLNKMLSCERICVMECCKQRIHRICIDNSIKHNNKNCPLCRSKIAIKENGKIKLVDKRRKRARNS